ncbi:HNH endonuclease [Virgibacillus halodenitrificans]|uniref:HNH endonuclease n=1 Tax=Virgibacillus halodenitrificans TaxID=1482 RepID=UPI000A6C5BF7|nr:HNH endonuclease [Virgibacillus halodenitrificans]
MDHSLDAYKNAKAFTTLQKTEYGIYGLASANGFSEYITGRDMVGNELSEEKRNSSLTEALFVLGVGYVSIKGVDGISKVATNFVADGKELGKGLNEQVSKAFDGLSIGNGPHLATAGASPVRSNTFGFVDQVETNGVTFQKAEGVSLSAKGTGDVQRSEIDEVIKNNYDKNGDLINRSIVPKGYESVEDFLKVVDDTTIKEFGYESVEEFKAVVGHVDDYLNASPKNNIVNKGLAGGKHVKDVDYDVLGFPIFKGDDVKFSMKLKGSMFKAIDDTQFKECTGLLKEAIEQGEISKSIFTPKQLRDIENGEARIKGLTWHHHQAPGKMQLVVSKTHKVNHLGGNKLCGDGIR